MPCYVPIYSPKYLDVQFDEMTRIFINDFIKIDEANRIVHLPMICLWYVQDFVPSSSLSLTTVSAVEYCVEVLANYVCGDMKSQLRRLFQNQNGMERSGSKGSLKDEEITSSTNIAFDPVTNESSTSTNPERWRVRIKTIFEKDKMADKANSSISNHRGFDIKFHAFDYRCANFVELKQLSHPPVTENM